MSPMLGTVLGSRERLERRHHQKQIAALAMTSTPTPTPTPAPMAVLCEEALWAVLAVEATVVVEDGA